MTAGLRPGGVDGIWRWIVIQPFSIVASRSSIGETTAGAGGAGGTRRAHAASATTASARRVATAALVVVLALTAGCASRPLLARAIRARGGPLHGFVRQSAADVYVGFPGAWRWRTVFADDGSRYRLGFDARLLVVFADGPVALPPLERGTLAARFADYRRVGDRWLAHRTDWVLADRPLAAERVVALCPDPRDTAAAAFRTPAGLPDCGPPPDARIP